MKVTVKIEADELVGAIHDLSNAMRTLSASGNSVSELIEQAVETKTTNHSAQDTVEEKKADTYEAPVVERAPVVEEKPKITLEDLRAKLGELSKNGKSAAVKALFSKYGATKLSDLSQDHYDNVMVEAEAL